MKRFRVYSGRNPSGAHLCVVEAIDEQSAMRIARLYFELGRKAYAVQERIGGAK